jgi:hypothetical protein
MNEQSFRLHRQLSTIPQVEMIVASRAGAALAVLVVRYLVTGP